jgi:EPS-associated MarR family transcriptional regulator
MPSPASEPTSDMDAAAALEALRLLEARPELSQRELSRALGLSLGKTHYVLHALLGKGLLKIENFRRNNNKLAYAYLLTPKGMKEKMRLTRSFLARKEAEFERLSATIARLRQEVHAAQATAPRAEP